MGIFDRFRRKDNSGTTAAGAYSGSTSGGSVTEQEAAWMLDLVQHAFEEQGETITRDGNNLVNQDGNVWGIGNLLQASEPHPREEWPKLAQEHAQIMLAARRGPAVSEADASLLLPRLRSLSDVNGDPGDYAQEILPGILAVVAVDRPTHIEKGLKAATFAGVGDIATVQSIALDNLRKLPLPDNQELTGDPDSQESQIRVFAGDDYFVPSRLLILDEVMEAVGDGGNPYGRLVIVPHRHLMAVHVVQGMGFVAALQGLVNLGLAQYAEGPAPLSPHVYFVASDGTAQQVTHPEDGKLVMRLDGRIGELFTQFNQ